MKKKKQNVWVGLSGGVDSSVAAALLKDEGHDVTGIYLKCWEEELPDGECPWEIDQNDARKVAEKLDIPFRSINLVKQYRENVFQYMVDEYEAGRTPNPDVVCNREIKFGLFLKEALENGADFIATGHYARLRRENINSNSPAGGPISKNKVKLLAGADKNKDQSYFLWQLTQEQLRHAMFPVGELEKDEVRRIAKERGFHTADKPDSTGVCFIGEVPMQKFLERYIPPSPGPVLTAIGKKVGEHKGLAYYTIGQRKGIGIFGGGPPYYVVEKDAERNALIVAPPADEAALYADELIADNLNWISGEAPPNLNDGSRTSIMVRARIRYRQPLQDCVLTRVCTNGKEEDTNIRGHSCDDSCLIRVSFKEPQRAITSGQSVVFYDGEEMLGGGVIC